MELTAYLLRSHGGMNVLEIFSSLLNYARRVEMSENVEYNWETVLQETWPHCEVVESL